MTDLDTWQTPFLQGLMAPVSDERDDRDLAVIGEIPSALRGMFVRTGPNPQFAPMGAYHPFDGDGMLHAVYLEDGAARYRNRFIESRGLLAERARGRACYGGMSNFRFPEPDVLAEGGMLKNTANTATVRHAGRYLSMLEACPPTEFDRDLNTLGEHDFGGLLQGPMTAHPKVDPVTGDMLFFGYSPMAPYLRYHEVNNAGQLVNSTEIEIPAPVMMHDFVITEHYAIFLDSPAVFDVRRMLDGGEPMSWVPDNGTRIGVIPRGGAGTDVRWFDVDNCYVVHFFNAWESGDTIEIRAPRMPDMPGGFNFENPGAAREPLPWGWTLDLVSGKVTDGQTSDHASEFPRVNESFTGRATRFGYACPQRTWDFEFDFEGVVKFDFENGSSSAHYYGESEVSGEHVFAPDPAGTGEDDGWLMSFVTDRATQQSELVILDARDVAAGPVARVQMAARVPLGFHANWFAD
ncbi:MAG: carotenoid oxygenase family protein [Ilumatobacteraceae bacterium]